MDPTATLQSAIDSMLDNDRDGAIEHLQELTGWLTRGGYLPRVDELR